MLVRISSKMVEEDGRLCNASAKQWQSTVKGYSEFLKNGVALKVQKKRLSDMARE
jgi:hypothetical protein